MSYCVLRLTGCSSIVWPCEFLPLETVSRAGIALEEIVEAAVLLHDVDDVRDFPGAGPSSARSAARFCMYGNACEPEAQPESTNASAVNAARRWLQVFFIC